MCPLTCVLGGPRSPHAMTAMRDGGENRRARLNQTVALKERAALGLFPAHHPGRFLPETVGNAGPVTRGAARRSPEEFGLAFPREAWAWICDLYRCPQPRVFLGMTDRLNRVYV